MFCDTGKAGFEFCIQIRLFASRPEPGFSAHSQHPRAGQGKHLAAYGHDSHSALPFWFFRSGASQSGSVQHSASVPVLSLSLIQRQGATSPLARTARKDRPASQPLPIPLLGFSFGSGPPVHARSGEKQLSTDRHIPFPCPVSCPSVLFRRNAAACPVRSPFIIIVTRRPSVVKRGATAAPAAGLFHLFFFMRAW